MVNMAKDPGLLQNVYDICIHWFIEVLSHKRFYPLQLENPDGKSSFSISAKNQKHDVQNFGYIFHTVAAVTAVCAPYKSFFLASEKYNIAAV